jgi:hypothetical protein
MPEKSNDTSNSLVVHGAIPNLKSEDASRLAVYLVRGNEIITQTTVDKKGNFKTAVDRSIIANRAGAQIEAVIGPAAMGRNLDYSFNLLRVPLNQNHLENAKKEFIVPSEEIKIGETLLERWWFWCRRYNLSGIVIGPDGCPVPGALVTVSTVFHASGGGFTVTPRKTVAADNQGNFTLDFIYCTRCGWPCWPSWWFCWPWWWEWDILHILKLLEARVPTVGPVPPGPLAVQTNNLPIKRPASADLMIGHGFPEARRSDDKLMPDQARTELIRRRLADPRIRAIFPWHWWCCENPNIIFTVNQGPNVILNEEPASDTRWCFPDNSTVTLIGNDKAVSTCKSDSRPAQGFVWTRVGSTLVNAIINGYAQGEGDASDLAFYDSLNLYGEFAYGSPIAYYQVLANLWTGNPARGGTSPTGSGKPIAAEFYDYAFMLHANNIVTVEAVKMGPFSSKGINNLYATRESRQSVPAGLLPSFPTGTFMAWADPSLKLRAYASSLIGGSVGAVSLAVAGYDSAFNPIALPPNSDDTLTLEIDTTDLTAAQIIDDVTVYNQAGQVIKSSSGADCPALDVSPGEYVGLTVQVTDNNGHLCEYELVPNYGHGTTDKTDQGVRGYMTPTPFNPVPAPYPNYQQPDIAEKKFAGGTERITYTPKVSCCYDFRLNVRKRVTDGSSVSSWYCADFRTVKLKVS